MLPERDDISIFDRLVLFAPPVSICDLDYLQSKSVLEANTPVQLQ